MKQKQSKIMKSDTYNYDFNENTYNLISYDMKTNENKTEYDVCVYAYDKNKDIEDYEKEPFTDTDAYDKIKNFTGNVLLINNNDLKKKTEATVSQTDNNKNKYFMLINIDGHENSRRYNIIPLDETNEIDNKEIDNNNIIKIPGGQMIPNTFYIINTYIGDIKRNLEFLKKLIQNKQLSEIDDKYKEIINPLNNEHYGLIQQIIFILVERKIKYNIKEYTQKENIIIEKDKIINELKLYGYYVYEITCELINYLSSGIKDKNRNMLNYIEDTPDYEINKKGYCKMINEFKNIVNKLMNKTKINDSKVLIYHSVINNQIGRSRNNGLLITHSLLTNGHIDEDYIKVLDSSGYLSYYGLIFSNAINIIDENQNQIENQLDENQNQIENQLDNTQIEKYLKKYKEKIDKDDLFDSIFNKDVNYKTDKSISFNSIKIIDNKKCVNSNNLKSASALYNSYNLHLYGKQFFIDNIKNILCFDADLSEDSGNGRMVYKNSETNYHDENTYLTIYGKMNSHYMPPIIQIFKNKDNDYILAALEDEKLNKWVDITKYNNIIKEIFHKHFIIIHIKLNNNKKDDLYIYYKKIHFSYYNNIINELFKIIDLPDNKNILCGNLFNIEADKINYKNHEVNIYLGFNLYNGKNETYYNYIYNLTNYKLNYILKDISSSDYNNYELSKGKINIIRFSNYVNKRISNVNGYYLLYNNTENSTGKEIIEKFKNIVLADCVNVENRYKYTLLEPTDTNLNIKPYVIAINDNTTTLTKILGIKTTNKELKDVIKDRKFINPFDKYIEGFKKGYSENYDKGYYNKEQTPPITTGEKYYYEGYNSGSKYGYECGTKDLVEAKELLNKQSKQGKQNQLRHTSINKYNKKYYLTRGKIYKFYYDTFKNNIINYLS